MTAKPSDFNVTGEFALVGLKTAKGNRARDFFFSFLRPFGSGQLDMPSCASRTCT